MVLAVLGAQLTRDERCELAATLPERARAVFASQIHPSPPSSKPSPEP
ncbi:hypothetical protein [Streptomyces sp. NPDC102437]